MTSTLDLQRRLVPFPGGRGPRRLWPVALFGILLGAPSCQEPTEGPEGAGLAADLLLTEVEEGLEIELGVGQLSYVAGERIEPALYLANRASEPRTLRFPTSQRYDFLILTLEGDEVYRWSADQAFLQVLGEETLQPAEELRFQGELFAPEVPGSYHLQGWITAQDTDLHATLPLEVRPP